MNELDHVDSIKNGRLFHFMSCELTVRFDWSSVIYRSCSDFSLVFYHFFVPKSRTKEIFSFIYSGAGSVENRAHPETSNKLCRTAYGYELFAKCMLANQKSPYFQDGGQKFKMAAKIYHDASKPGTISTQQCFGLVKFD